MPKFDGYTFIIHSQTIKVLTKDYESGEFTLQVGNYSTKKVRTSCPYNPQNHPDEFLKRNGSVFSEGLKRSGSILSKNE